MFYIIYFILCAVLAMILSSITLGLWWTLKWAASALRSFRRNREVKQGAANLPDCVPAEWQAGE